MSQINYANSVEMKGTSQSTLVPMDYAAEKRKVSLKGCAIFFVITVAALVGLCIGLYFIGKSDGMNEATQVVSSTIVTTAAVSTTTVPSGITPTPNLGYRLPKYAVPVKYRLTLFPDIYQLDPVNFTFSGWEIITIKMLVPGNRIFLHASESLIIDFDNLQLFENLPEDEEPLPLEFDPPQTTETNISLAAHFYHRQYAYHELVFDKMLTTREYKLRVSWTSRLLRDLTGLYYSTYNDSIGPVYLVATQFQPTSTRKAFPCFDEPEYKAIFESRLVRKTSHKTLSNAERARPARVNLDRVFYFVDVYQPTVVMSSYLNAFAVHNYVAINITDIQNRRVLRFWHRAEDAWKANTEYIASITNKMLVKFDEIYKTKYPFNKIDFIPFPDFSAGAMENWGLVTFAESTYYYNPLRDPFSQKERVAAITAHELAHMNFGNMVTTKWWDDTWLNEGFASYLEYPGLIAANATWSTDERFLIGDVLNSMRVDCLNSTRPITQPVETPSSISGMFDTITYSKGASLCRMMEAFVTKATFDKSLIVYQRTYQFKNTEHKELYDTITSVLLGESSSIPDVYEIMKGWTTQPGYPVLFAAFLSTNVFSISFNLSQTPFELEKGKFGYRKWAIPLKPFVSGRSELPQQFFTEEQGELTITQTGLNNWNGWFVMNTNHAGFFRINYEALNWQRLTTALLNNISTVGLNNALTRTQLIDDALYLARAGYPVMNYTLALDLSQYLCHENSYAPWQASLDGLNYVEQHYWQFQYDANLKKYGRHLIYNVFNYLGWDVSITAKTSDHYLRTSVMSRACRWQLPQCLDNATNYFGLWKESPDTYLIPTDTTSTVRCYGIKAGNADDWWWLYSLYLNSKVQTDRNNYINALGCSNDETLQKYFLEFSLKNSTIPAVEFPTIYAAVAANPAMHSLIKEFFYDNWEALLFNSSSSSGPRRALEGAFLYVNTQEELNELQEWKAKAGNLGAVESSYNALLVTIDTNIAWMNANNATVVAWLLDFKADRLPTDCPRLST